MLKYFLQEYKNLFCCFVYLQNYRFYVNYNKIPRLRLLKILSILKFLNKFSINYFSHTAYNMIVARV